MSDKTIPLLLTSCIIVSAKYTALSDTELRLTETIKSLEKWTTTPDIEKIVICDGSGFDITPYVHHLKDKGEFTRGLHVRRSKRQDRRHLS